MNSNWSNFISSAQIALLLENDRLDQAEARLAEALRQSPEDPALILLSAHLEYEKDNYAEAEEILRRVLVKDPENDSARYLLVRVLTALDRYAEAEKVVIGLIREFPEDPDYYAQYAYIMLVTLHVEKSGKLAAAALRLDSGHLFASYISAVCALIRNDDQGARERLAAMMREHPENMGTSRMVLTALIHERRNREALRMAREILRSNPADLGMVEIVKQLRIQTHPTMIPLWPFSRFGWHGSAALWAAFVVFVLVGRRFLPADVVSVVAWCYIGLCVYSWVYPPILRRLMR